jgi:hypothetical protein
MCAVSNIGDQYSQQFQSQYSGQFNLALGGSGTFYPPVTRREFDSLRNEVIQMKQLLIEAKAKDEAEGNPDCEMEEKVKVLRAVAEAVGVSLEEVFGDKK